MDSTVGLTSPTAACRWRVALPEDMAGEAIEVLKDIARSLPGPGTGLGPSLVAGEAGMALFHAYYSLGFEGGAGPHRSLAEAHLEAAVRGLPELNGIPQLFGGYTGVAWTVEHLQHLGFLEDDGDLNEEIDEALLEDLAAHPGPHLCELIAGLAGYGLYGLERWPRAGGKRVLAKVLDLLEGSAEHQGTLVTWFSPPELLHPLALQEHPGGCYNLGLSHGVPGAIGFLAKAAALGDARARVLVEGAVPWLLAEATPMEDGSTFTYSFHPGSKRSGTRVSWCYGDLGVAASLMLAARHLGRADWDAPALELAKRTALRPVEGPGAMDGGLCHGWFGNAHLFNRFWQATGDEACHRTMLAWFRLGLDRRQPGQHLAGYWSYQPYDYLGVPLENPYVPEPGLLEGTAGIGLALLAALTPIEPRWDSHLLVDLPLQPLRP